MEAVPISQEVIDRFKNENSSQTSGPDNPDQDQKTQALTGLNESVSWLLRTLDSLARNKDERLGTDQETIELYSELSVLVAERNISSDILRKSPELFLGTVTAGIFIEKFMVLQTIKKEELALAQKQREQSQKENKDA